MGCNFICTKNNPCSIHTDAYRGIKVSPGYLARAGLDINIWTNIPHATHNYVTRKYHFEVDYYRHKYFSSEKVAHIRKKLEISGQEVMYSYKSFNSNYMEFFGYETCDKLIWTSGKGCRNTNIIVKQGIPKINMNMTYPSETLGFSCYPHKDTYDIFSEILFSHRLQSYS